MSDELPDLSDLPDFERLCDQLRDQSLSETDFRRLEQMLLANRRARNYYIRYTTLHSGLNELARLQTPNERVSPAAVGNRSRQRFFGTLGALAAGLLLCVGYYQWHLANRPAATIIAEHQVQWERVAADEPASASDQSMTPGRYTLASGVVKLRLKCGADVTLQSPATFELFEDKQFSLERGRLVAAVPKVAHGFRVNTQVATVTDLGTRFGVSVSDHGFQTHVFEGKVQATMRQSGDAFNLDAGAAIVLPSADLTVKNVNANQSHFVTQWPAKSSMPIIRGSAELLLAPPQSLRVKDCELLGKQNLCVFKERERVTLESPVDVDISQPGECSVFSGAQKIESGVTADTYFAHFYLPPAQRRVHKESFIKGSLTFDRDIIGASVHHDGHQIFQNPDTRYRTSGGQLEGVRNDGTVRDQLSISRDQRTLTFKVLTSTREDDLHDWVDQFRIFVKSDQ